MQDPEVSPLDVAKLLAAESAGLAARDRRFKNVRVRQFFGPDPEAAFDIVLPSGRRFHVQVTRESDSTDD